MFSLRWAVNVNCTSNRSVENLRSIEKNFNINPERIKRAMTALKTIEGCPILCVLQHEYK